MSRAKREGKQIALLQEALHKRKEENKRLREGLSGKQAPRAQKQKHHWPNKQCKAVKRMVRAAVDPEGSTPERIPLWFPEATSVFKTKIVQNIPFMTATHGTLLQGEFAYRVQPDPINPLQYLDELSGPVEVRGSLGANTNNFGAYKVESTHPTQHPVYLNDTKIIINSGDVTSISVPMWTIDGTIQLGARNGDYIYYPTALGRIDFNVNTVFTGAATGNLIIEALDLFGSVKGTTTLGYTGATGQVQVTLNIASSSNPPDELYSWRIQVTNQYLTGTLTPIVIDSIHVAVEFTEVYWKNVSVPDASTMLSDIDRYRVTAQSCLSTYVGSLLTNAGQISSALYKGGKPYTHEIRPDYDTIGELPQAYNGKLLDGSYTYWEPCTYTDQNLVGLNTADPFSTPWMIHAGIFNDTTNQNELRVIVTTHIEFLSTSQLYPRVMVVPDLCALEGMARVLMTIPNCMANDKHRSFIEKVMRALDRAASWAVDHADDIGKVAAATGH
jgi:hypothetical protein